MKVQMNTNNAQSFKARLFTQNGEIKEFNPKNSIFLPLDNNDTHKMSKRGSKETTIFVEKFISKQNVYGGYENSVEIAVKNPLFGFQKFTKNLYHETNCSIVNDKHQQLRHLDLLTGIKSNNCASLEDKALRMTLIDNINNKTFETFNPVEILSKMLEQETRHGFSLERINDFKKIAADLLNEIILKGIKQVKK